MAYTKEYMIHTSQAIYKNTQNKDTIVRHTTTAATGFNRNNPIIMLPDNHPPQGNYLQSKEHHLHDCGGSHIRIGKKMSSLSQYKT
jgi:hypothetical protein